MGVADDCAHRRAQLMVYVGKKLRLELARLLKSLIGNRQCLRALSHLTLKSRVRLPEMRGHLVELVRENFDLVAGVEMEAVTQIPFADPFDAAAKRLKRPNHPSSHNQARQHRHREANQKKSRSQ